MNNVGESRRMSRKDRNKLESLEGQLGFRIKKARLGIVQKSIQCATLTDGATTTLRVIGMPAGSPQDRDAFMTAANTIVISSTSADDTLAGTGVQKINVAGLDINFDVITEDIDMNGQSAATSTKQFFRIQKIQSIQVGSTGINVGDIYVSETGSTLTAGVPADGEIFRAMFATTNFDTMGIFTVPRATTFHYQMLNSYGDAIDSKPFLILQESIIPAITTGQRIRYKVGDLWTTTNISWNATGSLEEFATTDMIFSTRTKVGTASVNYYNEYSLIPDSLIASHG